MIPLHAAQNKLTVLPVRGQTPWTRSKPDSIESFAAELLRRIKSGRELSAKLAAAHGATTTSGEAGLAARELAQAAGHQAQMAAQDSTPFKCSTQFKCRWATIGTPLRNSACCVLFLPSIRMGVCSRHLQL